MIEVSAEDLDVFYEKKNREFFYCMVNQKQFA